jgi:hypothetical protein
MHAGGDADSEPSLSDHEALVEALAAVDQEKATWTRYDLARQLTLTLQVAPDLDAAGQLARIDRLVDAALGTGAAGLGVVNLTPPAACVTPVGLRRSSDGASVYEEHSAERFTTDEGLARELRMLDGARRSDGPKLDPDVTHTPLLLGRGPTPGWPRSASRRGHRERSYGQAFGLADGEQDRSITSGVVSQCSAQE